MPRQKSLKASSPKASQIGNIARYDKLLREFEKKFNLEVRAAKQGSERWHEMKLGVISASNASRAVAKKESDTRHTYLCELVAEICTGVIEEVSFKQMEWGKSHEDAARSSFEFSTGQEMIPLNFVFKDNKFRAGCSPDGVILPIKPAEIKCPWDSANYIKFLIDGIQKPDWVWQNQMTMWVMGAREMDVTQFDPRMKTKPIHTIIVSKDPEKQKKLDDAIPELIFDMDKMLKEIGVEFGDQWHRISQKGKRHEPNNAA